MDKVLSARVGEATVARIGNLAKRLHASKKKIIESAIEMYANEIEEEQNMDVLDRTFGAWRRKKSARQLVAASRQAFQRSMTRHQE